MILLIVVMGVVNYKELLSFDREFEEVFKLRMPGIDLLVEIDRDLQQLLVAERSMIFTDTNSEDFKDLMSTYEENLGQVKERWKKIYRITGIRGGRKVTYSDLQRCF